MTAESKTVSEKKEPSSKSKFAKLKANLNFRKRNAHLQDDTSTLDGLMTIKINTKQNNFAEAGKQLICREEQLFALKQEGVGTSRFKVDEEEDYEENLLKDREDFLKQVFSTVEKSLEVPPQTVEERELLKNAILAIKQEEEQDKRWEGVEEKKRPSWRPRCCRQYHDELLCNMVQQRLEEATLDSKVNIKSSLQIEVIGKGKRLKEDLLQIVKNLKNCYPGENVCQLYVNLYHQGFSDNLRKLTEYGLAIEDCSFLLTWVNNYYPSILKNKDLEGVIEYEQLEPLLPNHVLKELEQQFLSGQEDHLQTWFSNALSRDEKEGPELRDGYYFTPLAIDVIQCFHGVLTSTQEVLGSLSNAQELTNQMHKFFINYQSFLEKVIKDNKENTDAVLKANLLCIREFRNYLTNNQESAFPEHIQTKCLNLLTNMRDNCHCYFTKPIHADLKSKYSNIGSSKWLKENELVCSELLNGVHSHIQKMSNLDQACLKDIVSQLHEELLVKYVRKMMQKKLKLKNEQKQQQAAEALRNNSQKIHTMFAEAGSDMNDLKAILPDLAELLILKDPQCIELQLVMLSRNYPDLSEGHVSAWMYIKGTLSKSEVKKIKKAFQESVNTAEVPLQDSLYSCRNFFSKVTVT